LAALLTKADTADSSLPYSLHRAYGDAALPFLDRAARDSQQVRVRIACAEELILANRAEGYRYLVQTVKESPSTRQGALQFIRDRFPDLRSASEDTVTNFIESKADAR
jgi:hypothetical protein